MTTNLDPDVADLLRAIRDHLANDDVTRCAAHTRGVLGAILDGDASLKGATWAFAKLAVLDRPPPPTNVCDTCHSEPVTVITPDKRQCATCALKVCDCCQFRRATVVWGVTDLCPLCFEERAAEAEVTYAP